MDPLTLFALANSAVVAVKKGCELYNEVKGVAGNVKGVLQDLEYQYNTRYKNRKPTSSEKNQYTEERNRIVNLSKKEPNDIYSEIGQHLGTYFESMATCMAIFEEDARQSHEVYTGTESVGSRALQRVLMESKLVAMQAEIREIMVYHCPPELGGLYNRVEKMMVQIKREQSIAISNKNRRDQILAIKQERLNQRIKDEIITWVSAGVIIIFFVTLMALIVEVRKEEYPELGVCFIPKGQWPYKEYNKLKWVDCDPR